MPLYEYECVRCNYDFDVWKSISKLDNKEQCPECLMHQTRRKLSIPNFIIEQEPKTIGELADKNTKNFGKTYTEDYEGKLDDKKEAMLKESEDKIGVKALRKNKKPKTPWYRSGEVQGLSKMDKPLDVDKIKDVTKYVLKGDTE